MLVGLATFGFKIAFACNECQRNQPDFLLDVSHGDGPDSYTDYVIVVSGIIVVLITTFLALKYLFQRKKEASTVHIKHTILEN